MRTKLLAILLLTAIISNFAFVVPASADGEVLFECENLKAALEEIIGKQDITADDMYELQGKLDLSYKNIKSLAGLEYAVNVSDLVLSFNNITDISPLTALTNLESLYLDYNWIKTLPDRDMGLSSLEHLDISNNEIAEIPAAFLTMPELRRLYAGELALESAPDFSAVADTLSRLDISGAKLADFSFVEGMNGLELLVMNGCGMTQLPNLSGMGNLAYLYVSGNELNALPDYLAGLPLVRLDISGNLLSSLPDSFQSLSRMEQLVMTDNYFEMLPYVVTLMKNLEVLMCGQNIIRDVPDNLYDLKNIKRASFASNGLTSLYKFQEFDIPYSYQISFDLNYLDLNDEMNLDVLDDYRNDGGVQRQAQLSVQPVKADTESFVIQCGFDTYELDRLGQSAVLYKLMLFRRENGALSLVGETDLSDGANELIVSQTAPPEGTADYLACLVIKDGVWPERLVKYPAGITVNIVTAPTAEPREATAAPTVTPAVPSAEPSQTPAEGVDKRTKYLLYILLLGVIIIISAIIIHLVFYRRK